MANIGLLKKPGILNICIALNGNIGCSLYLRLPYQSIRNVIENNFQGAFINLMHAWD